MIFISSTIYDLIDIRHELQELILGFGSNCMLSENALSDFEISGNENSIETCLANVRRAHTLIVILDKRYGSTLEKYGYPGISATNLEYQEAMRSKVRTLFFIRDRLEGDYSIWKKMGRPDTFTPAWANAKDCIRIFKFIEDRSGATSSDNWVGVYHDSIDLKAQVAKACKIEFAQNGIVADLKRNNFPLLHASMDVNNCNYKNTNCLKCVVSMKNISDSPAFKLVGWWSGDENKFTDSAMGEEILGPHCKMNATCFYPWDLRNRSMEFGIKVQYSSVDGICIEEIYEMHARIEGGIQPAIASGISMKERKFILGSPFQIKFSGE